MPRGCSSRDVRGCRPDVRFETGGGPHPEGAVQDFENKKVVFVPGGKNTFAWREVGTGGLIDGRLEIVKGLAAGEPVVAEGAFDIKAEILKRSLEDE